jgi:four helix bundle protein
MRRAATSISSNIAEGAGRQSEKEFQNFLQIAQGSNSELETQLLLCVELNYISEEVAKPLLSELNEISRMIVGLMRSLNDPSR